MKKLVLCIHGGNSGCHRHGGSGTLYHAEGYAHPIVSADEVSIDSALFAAHPADSEVRVSSTDYRREVPLGFLGEYFNDPFSKSILDTKIDPVVRSSDLVSKSLFNFDLSTEEGITRLLDLLPIMSDEIVQEIYQRIWVGYPKENIVVRIAKLEIRGYLMDYLHDQGE